MSVADAIDLMLAFGEFIISLLGFIITIILLKDKRK